MKIYRGGSGAGPVWSRPGIIKGALWACFFSVLCLAGCGRASGEGWSLKGFLPEGILPVPSASGDIFAMDTVMSVSCYGDECEEALDESLEEIRRLDRLLSTGREDSEIALLNRNGSGRLSGDSRIMMEGALRIWEDTDGAFDITIYPLMKLWGFTDKNYAVPGEEELKECLALVDSGRIGFDPESGETTLMEGQGIDFGGIAKGYTSNRLMEIFRAHSLKCGLVSLGGNVQCYGARPDGKPWRCAIANPGIEDAPGGGGGSAGSGQAGQTGQSDRFLGVISGSDTAIITSGGYERYFVDEKTQKRYHHILDPDTGYPADNSLLSVTIVCRDGMMADALSTACFVMGREKSAEFWRERAGEFDMVLAEERDGDGGGVVVYYTEGLEGYFESEYETRMISE